jgi:hypothetical protein
LLEFLMIERKGASAAEMWLSRAAPAAATATGSFYLRHSGLPQSGKSGIHIR